MFCVPMFCDLVFYVLYSNFLCSNALRSRVLCSSVLCFNVLWSNVLCSNVLCSSVLGSSQWFLMLGFSLGYLEVSSVEGSSWKDYLLCFSDEVLCLGSSVVRSSFGFLDIKIFLRVVNPLQGHQSSISNMSFYG